MGESPGGLRPWRVCAVLPKLEVSSPAEAGVRPDLTKKDRRAQARFGHLADLSTASAVLSAVVATALWPLILLGASLHLSLARL
jgi:hypothetical protein